MRLVKVDDIREGDRIGMDVNAADGRLIIRQGMVVTGRLIDGLKRLQVKINLKLTHQQIAELVGAVRETASKILLELQDEGLITVHQKKIILKDPVYLEKKATEV